MSKAFGVKARRVIKRADLRGAVREMLDTPGPYLLEVMVPVRYVTLFCGGEREGGRGTVVMWGKGGSHCATPTAAAINIPCCHDLISIHQPHANHACAFATM